MTIINKLFVYTVDPQTGKKQIRVTPSLKEDALQDIVVETRALIIKLYLTCEVDYVNSLNLYEAIVDSKIFETAQNQIDSLNKMSDKLKKEVKKNKPWLLYYNKNNDTPVRLYGYAENNTENNAKNKEDISYLVCTMEDDETNSLCYGVLEDINRISSVSWENINNTYIDNLKKSIPYGGDMIFLKPEMFLFVSKYHIR